MQGDDTYDLIPSTLHDSVDGIDADADMIGKGLRESDISSLHTSGKS